MPRIKTSPIWTISKERLEEIVNSAVSLSDALRLMGITFPHGKTMKLQERCKQDNISYEHLVLKVREQRTTRVVESARQRIIPIDEFFTENSCRSRIGIRRRILRDGLLPYKCPCGNNGMWLNQPLKLDLHHKDGNYRNNKLDNLMFMCPNCHAQDKFSKGGTSDGTPLAPRVIDAYHKTNGRNITAILNYLQLRRSSGNQTRVKAILDEYGLKVNRLQRVVTPQNTQRVVKSWFFSKEERTEALTLKSQGFSDREIARRMNRSHHTIYRMVKKNAQTPMLSELAGGTTVAGPDDPRVFRSID